MPLTMTDTTYRRLAVTAIRYWNPNSIICNGHQHERIIVIRTASLHLLGRCWVNNISGQSSRLVFRPEEHGNITDVFNRRLLWAIKA